MRTAIYRDLFIRSTEDNVSRSFQPNFPSHDAMPGTMVHVMALDGSLLADVVMYPNPKWWVTRYRYTEGPEVRIRAIRTRAWGFDWYDTLIEALDSIADWQHCLEPVEIVPPDTATSLSHGERVKLAAPELDAIFTLAPAPDYL